MSRVIPHHPPFNSEMAKEYQKRSVAKRKQNQEEKKLIRAMLEERLKDEDLQAICDNLIKRAKKKSKDFETLQAALGQKPVDKVERVMDVVVDFGKIDGDE